MMGRGKLRGLLIVLLSLALVSLIATPAFAREAPVDAPEPEHPAQAPSGASHDPEPDRKTDPAPDPKPDAVDSAKPATESPGSTNDQIVGDKEVAEDAFNDAKDADEALKKDDDDQPTDEEGSAKPPPEGTVSEKPDVPDERPEPDDVPSEPTTPDNPGVPSEPDTPTTTPGENSEADDEPIAPTTPGERPGPKPDLADPQIVDRAVDAAIKARDALSKNRNVRLAGNNDDVETAEFTLAAPVSVPAASRFGLSENHVRIVGFEKAPEADDSYSAQGTPMAGTVDTKKGVPGTEADSLVGSRAPLRRAGTEADGSAEYDGQAVIAEDGKPGAGGGLQAALAKVLPAFVSGTDVAGTDVVSPEGDSVETRTAVRNGKVGKAAAEPRAASAEPTATISLLSGIGGASRSGRASSPVGASHEVDSYQGASTLVLGAGSFGFLILLAGSLVLVRRLAR